MASHFILGESFVSWHISKPFPVQALGRVLGPAVWQHQSNTRLSLDMIAPLALGYAGGAVQDLVDVQRPNLPPSPPSLYVTVIAGSGEGKDTGAGPFQRPFLNIQANADDEAQALRPAFSADAIEWELKRKNLVKELAAAIVEGGPTVEIKKTIAAHERQTPVPFPLQKVLYKDATPKALKLGLCDWRSAVLSSMEAGEFFNGYMSTDFALVNDGWQGSPIVVDRVRGSRRSIADPRLGIVLGVQPEPFMRFLRRRGVEAHDSGFTARFLVALPTSTRGMRMIDGIAQATNFVDMYIARAMALLEESAAGIRARKPRRVLRFTSEAEMEFTRVYNRIQELMQWGNLLFDIPGFASKAAENISRVAAVLHLIDDLEGDINMDTLRRATCIIEWFTHQFKFVFTQADIQPTLEHDANVIEQALATCRSSGQLSIPTKQLKYWIPGMSAKRLARGVDNLLGQGRATLTPFQGADYLGLSLLSQLSGLLPR